MRKFVLLLVIVFSMVLISGCTDINDEFKKEVESTNSIIISNFDKWVESAISEDYIGVVSSASFMNRDAKEGRERILAITNTNETIKNEYLSALRTVEDASYTLSNLNAGALLATSNTKSSFNKIGADLREGMDGIIEVQSIWDESIMNTYQDKISQIQKNL